MVVAYVILGLFAGLVLYLLFAPFYLEIDTSKSICMARLHWLGVARLLIRENSLVLRWRILGIGKDTDLVVETRGPKSSKPNKRSKKPRKAADPPLRKIIAVIRSFKVNKFSLQLDTGNMELNGLLFPWLSGVSWLLHRNVWINFNDRNELILEIENNAFRVLRAFLFTNKTVSI